MRVDISPESTQNLVTSLQGRKDYKQMLLCVEKENAVGPCTHHVHAIINFTENVPKPTFAKWVNCWLCCKYNKDEGAVLKCTN